MTHHVFHTMLHWRQLRVSEKCTVQVFLCEISPALIEGSAAFRLFFIFLLLPKGAKEKRNT